MNTNVHYALYEDWSFTNNRPSNLLQSMNPIQFCNTTLCSDELKSTFLNTSIPLCKTIVTEGSYTFTREYFSKN